MTVSCAVEECNGPVTCSFRGFYFCSGHGREASKIGTELQMHLFVGWKKMGAFGPEESEPGEYPFSGGPAEATDVK